MHEYEEHIEYPTGTEVKVKGFVNLDEMVRYHSKHFGRPDIDRLKFHLINLSECTGLKVEEAVGIIHFNKNNHTYNKKHTICYTAYDQDLKLTIQEMIKTIQNPLWNYVYIDSLEDARDYCLNLD